MYSFMHFAYVYPQETITNTQSTEEWVLACGFWEDTLYSS
jgi:hypothetical protein